MSNTIFPDSLETANSALANNPSLKSPANHGASTLTTRIGFSEWLGRHDIFLFQGNDVLRGFYLDAPEARDLAAALLKLADHVDGVAS